MRPLIEKIMRPFGSPRLTRGRIVLALVVAAAADGLQIPFQAVPVAPEIIDLIAMILTTLLLGFHLLLLPTFVVEFIPIVDMMPTWLGCVLAVIALRRREQGFAASQVESQPTPLPPAAPPLIAPPPEPGLPPKLPPATGA